MICLQTEKIGDWYHWTIGGPYNGYEWRKSRIVPRLRPLPPLVFIWLSGPILRDTAILSLRYPISRDSFSGRVALPKTVRYPPLVLSFTQAHLCNTPFCNISRDSCAIPHKNKHERVLRYYRKSIAAGPLSLMVGLET